MAKQRKKKWWIWIVLLLVAAAVVVGVLLMQDRVRGSYQSETVQARDITTYYSFSGHLTPVYDEIQTAKDGLKVKELYVAEGDLVAKDQPLLRGTDGTRVYAQAAGTLETLFVEADDTVPTGGQIARLVDYSALEVSVDVDEYDVSSLTVGKSGQVYLNALETTVTGTVTEIGREATVSGDVTYYPVKLEIADAEGARSGMSVEVQVLNAQAAGAPSLPLKALAYDAYNKPYVFLRSGEEMTMQYVTLGLSDGVHVQVLDGLTDGQTVWYAEDDMARFFAMQRNAIQSVRDN